MLLFHRTIYHLTHRNETAKDIVLEFHILFDFLHPEEFLNKCNYLFQTRQLRFLTCQKSGIFFQALKIGDLFQWALLLGGRSKLLTPKTPV